MKFIVARPVPFTKAQQRRRQRRPEFLQRETERKHPYERSETGSTGARWNRTNGLLMNDKQLHQEPDGTGRTAQPALFRTVLSDETGLSRNETIACRQPYSFNVRQRESTPVNDQRLDQLEPDETA